MASLKAELKDSDRKLEVYLKKVDTAASGADSNKKAMAMPATTRAAQPTP